MARCPKTGKARQSAVAREEKEANGRMPTSGQTAVVDKGRRREKKNRRTQNPTKSRERKQQKMKGRESSARAAFSS
jgi:hypothetical protein